MVGMTSAETPSMKPFQKILVPTDFSAHAEDATRVAADLARRYEAALTLIYVYEPLGLGVPDSLIMLTSDQLQQLSAAFEQSLTDARRGAIAAGAPKVDSRLLQGSPASGIIDFANQGGFDLIVMGTHGRQGVQHFLLGSIAERVVRAAPCPVLTVRLPKKV
jgi:universal stress protein A